MKKIFILSILIFNFATNTAFSKNNLYEKIDLFGEVLERLNTLSPYKKIWEEISSLRTAFHKKFISKIPFCDLKVFSNKNQLLLKILTFL